jgi:predicted nuclease of restriction endonuclease-like (RecB) superfamily
MENNNSRQDLNTEISASVKALKLAILQAQYAASADSNRVMLMLYLGIGRFISQKTRNGIWGDGATNAIAEQLQREMPGLRGFSGVQLRRMRQFYEEWHDSLICSPLASKLVVTQSTDSSQGLIDTPEILQTNLPILAEWSICSPLANKLNKDEFFAISFTHHMEIIVKAKELDERLFYIHETVINHWNKDVLRSQLKADIYHHSGKMPSNFSSAITETKLAMKALGMFRDEYLLDFINTEELDVTNPEDIDEPVIEHAIVAHIRQFILTFGRDFSFISNQYRLEVMGEEQFIDLLFFNRELNCLVAVELKKGNFKSSYLGQLNLYLQALDDQERKPHENPPVGIILCKSANRAFVEYAVRDYKNPMGVATYRTADEMPERLRKALPDIEELKRQLSNTSGRTGN